MYNKICENDLSTLHIHYNCQPYNFFLNLFSFLATGIKLIDSST